MHHPRSLRLRRCWLQASALVALVGIPLLWPAGEAAAALRSPGLLTSADSRLVAQWGYQAPPRAPRPPQSFPRSGGSDWPAPGWPSRGLPTMNDYNRAVNYWIRRSSGPMGIDPCALSDLHETSCD